MKNEGAAATFVFGTIYLTVMEGLPLVGSVVIMAVLTLVIVGVLWVVEKATD